MVTNLYQYLPIYTNLFFKGPVPLELLKTLMLWCLCDGVLVYLQDQCELQTAYADRCAFLTELGHSAINAPSERNRERKQCSQLSKHSLGNPASLTPGVA